MAATSCLSHKGSFTVILLHHGSTRLQLQPHPWGHHNHIQGVTRNRLAVEMPSVDSWCLFLDVNGDVGERFSCGRGFHPDPESREPFNHSTWFLSLEFCTSWIKSLKSLRLIFITWNLHIMNQNQVAYLLYCSCSNYFSSVEHFEPRISIAHVQFFRLQVPFSPKFEADFWPDERLEQVSNLITVFYFQDLFSWFSFSGKPSEKKPSILWQQF